MSDLDEVIDDGSETDHGVSIKFNGGDPVVNIRGLGYRHAMDAIDLGTEIIDKATQIIRARPGVFSGPSNLPDALIAGAAGCEFWVDNELVYRCVDYHGRMMPEVRFQDGNAWRPIDSFTIEQVMSRKWQWRRPA